MASIAVPKTLLCVLLLSVITTGLAGAAEPARVYRFGGWTLLMPADADEPALASGRYSVNVPAEGLELLAYWQDGSQRAVALRFSGSDIKLDAVAMKSFHRSNRLKGCKFGAGARVKSYKDAVPENAPIQAFPDDGVLLLKGSDRSLRRAGEVLVADLGNARVQFAEDSPTVRLGEWNSADFCRFELKPAAAGDDSEDDFEPLR